MAQPLKSFAALPEELSSALQTHTGGSKQL